MLTNQSGKVLPIVLAISLLAQLLGGYLLTQSVINRKLVQYEEAHVFLKYSAEAGFQWSLNQIYNYQIVEGNVQKTIRDIMQNDEYLYEGYYTISYTMLSEDRVRITVHCTISTLALDLPMNHTIAAIVNSETLQIIRKEHYDF